MYTANIGPALSRSAYVSYTARTAYTFIYSYTRYTAVQYNSAYTLPQGGGAEVDGEGMFLRSYTPWCIFRSISCV